MTPSCSSLSRPCLTAAFQCRGTVLGVWMALGVADSSVKIFMAGDLSISFKGCFSQQLKAELAYLSRINFFSCGKLSTVGAHGRIGGDVGGSSRLGHVHAVSEGVGTPELEHCVGLILWTFALTWLL